MLIHDILDYIVGVLILTPGFCSTDDTLILIANLDEMQLKVDALE